MVNRPIAYLLAGLTGSRSSRHRSWQTSSSASSHPREAYKKLVEDAGGTWRLIYLKVDEDELLRRLAERNLRSDTNALTVTPEMLEDFFARFEAPVGEGEVEV